MFTTPILFIIFNRSDTTKQVFERIRQIKPSKLYVAADGPRKHKEGEVEKCRQTRKVIEDIDWECKLKTLYREENLGCKMAVSSAISWFFGQEEYGIILEDDCLPDLSFFPYCEELLLKYKDDTRIGHISGNNFFPRIIKNDSSYDFCSIAHIWGWATWRRVWANYDVKFTYWTDHSKNRKIRDSIFLNLRERIYFSSFISEALENKKVNTWDVQYLFMLRTQNQLSIYPCENLVENIGLQSENATNTHKGKSLFRLSKKISIPLKHPRYIMPNREIDNKTIKNIFSSYTRFFKYLM